MRAGARALSSASAAPSRIPRNWLYGFDGLPKRPLYRVRIRQTDIWPEYKGSDKDVLELEIYEHWLEKA
jgi:nitrile hydratase